MFHKGQAMIDDIKIMRAFMGQQNLWDINLNLGSQILSEIDRIGIVFI